MKRFNNLTAQQHNENPFEKISSNQLFYAEMLWIKGGGNDEDDYGDDSDDQDDGFN
mgnify:CR=1 FL=1